LRIAEVHSNKLLVHNLATHKKELTS